MRTTTQWPEIEDFRDHSKWRPDWTADRPRLLWYLTFEDHAEFHAAATVMDAALADCNADVVPPRWLHMTLTDVGFIDELDDRVVHASSRRVVDAVRGMAPQEVTLGPLGALPGAVVLMAGPARQLLRLRERVRRATARAGIPVPDDLDGPFVPHVSLCYMRRDSDHDRLRHVVEACEPRTVTVRCDRVSQVVVSRTNGHYEWQLLAEAPLCGVQG